jgi:hypothetical protein
VRALVPQNDERVRVGDPITLKRPNGTSLAWQIDGIEVFCGRVSRADLHILLKGLGKEDVPIGTEIWSADALGPARCPGHPPTP